MLISRRTGITIAAAAVILIGSVAGYLFYRGSARSDESGDSKAGFVRMSDPAAMGEVRVHDQTRKCEATSIPGERKWIVDVPDRSRLQFSVTIDPPSEAAKMTALVDVAGKNVFKREVAGGKNWVNVEVDLSGRSGRRVEIVFRAAAGEGLPEGTRALWSNPVLTWSGSGAGRRNFLIISIDALRADHLGCYGYHRPTSPVIDSLAAEGRRFPYVYTTQSSTWPALTSLMTSLQPSSSGVTWNGYMLKKNVACLPEIMSEAGYATTAFLANMGRGTHRGYDQRYIAGDGKITRHYLRQLTADRDKPFFHWIHYLATHDSYFPPKPYRDLFGKVADPLIGKHRRLTEITQSGRPPSPEQLQDILRLYDGEIRAVDDLIRQILDGLRKLGLDSRTVIIFTADHGEELFDRQNYSFHSGTVDVGTLRIPLIIRADEVGKGTVDETPSSIIDIAPTILEMAGLKAPAEFQGQSLLLPPEKRRGESLSETWEAIFSIVDSAHRYNHNPKNIRPRTEAGGYLFTIGSEELFDIKADPLEKQNIAGRNREAAERYRARLLQWKELVVTAPVEKQEIDKQTEEELKALGYVGETGG